MGDRIIKETKEISDELNKYFINSILEINEAIPKTPNNKIETIKTKNVAKFKFNDIDKNNK